MTAELDATLDSLSPIQKEAATWGEGPALVLAGPGSGKTRVLTCRIAKMLDDSRRKNFRILALTFTTKAAAEMRDRVDRLVPGLIERTFIGTFHAFCTQLLRQHGSHLGMAPDFTIFDQDADREALLSDALAANGEINNREGVRWLRTIDQLKSRLVVPEKAASQFRDKSTGEAVAKVYLLYEQALSERNSIDFNGLILGACRLFRDVVGVAERTRRTYPYWLIDEFQDTSPAQYRLIQLAAGDAFKNVFAVADDDQIIYQWAGASYRQIEKIRTDFRPELIQLVENHRCPPEIVGAANLLVAHNTFRTPGKRPLVAAKEATPESMSLRLFDTDAAESEGLAAEIAHSDSATWGETAILGRTRSLLVPIQKALTSRGVKAVIAERRDRFISPQFTWLQACLDQALHPTDVRTFNVLVDSANRVAGQDLDPAILAAEADAAGVAYFEHWGNASLALGNAVGTTLGGFAVRLAQSRNSWPQIVREALPVLVNSASSGEGVISDAADDKAAWDACVKEIRAEKGGNVDLDELIQGLALRSKEPPRDPSSLTLLTIHASKGLEFDTVYVAGLAESVMPSWQSINKGNQSPEMEEERRNCFVAITRTRKALILSRAARYHNWAKGPSRFLSEMGFAPSP
jgi:DNA helicase II / ATP-dependent DNA helicase PcrA